MSFDYFYGQQSDLFTFYRVPKVLFTNERFWNISADAKMLYGILLDRMSLSAKNGWIDKNGRVYIIFTIDEAKMALNCAEQKAIENDLLNNFRRLGVIATTMNGKERLHLMHSMFHMGDNDKFFFDWKYLVESGLSVKDFIAPTAFAFTNVVSYVIGILLLVIGGSAIYCIVKALWQSLLILVVLGIATIAVVFLLVWAVMKAENIGESLGAFIRS